MASESEAAPRSFEKITRLDEMIDLIRCLGLRLPNGCTSIPKMKDCVRDHVRLGAERKRHGAQQVFSLISDAVQKDLHKRDQLNRFLSNVESSLARLDGKSLELLNKNMAADVKGSLAVRRACLRRDYIVLVAGETSAGKSSFLNMILGDEMLPSAVLCTTKTICELRFGEKRQVRVQSAAEGPGRRAQPTTSYLLRDDRPFREQISRFVTQGDENTSKRVQIFLPHPLLRHITIVDSPGIGESEELDEIVKNYLPEAFAFIYIINASNAGGVQKDRIEKLLHQVRKTSAEFNPRSALFICNKWDQVPFEEQEQVISHVRGKLHTCWPGLDLAKQVTYLSTRNAVVAQQYGIVTKELANLLDGIGWMITASMESSLKLHWGLLDDLLSRLIHRTQAFIKTSSKDAAKNRIKIQSVLERLEELDGRQKEVIRDLQAHLDSKTKRALEMLLQYLKSKDVKARFCHWDDGQIPQGESFEKLASAVEALCKNRAKQFIEEWEESEEAFSNARQSIVKYFGEKYKIFEEELLNLEQSVVTSHQGQDEERTQGNAALHPGFIPNIHLTTRDKIIIGATFPIWLPFSLVAVIIGTPVAVAAAAAKKGKLQRQKSNPRSFLERRSQSFIDDLANENAIRKFVEDQLEDARECLRQIQERIPSLIDADRALCNQLLDDDRSRKRTEKFFKPLHEACTETRGQLAMFALQKILPLDDEVDGLKWREHPKYLLGSGGFARVYKGKLLEKSDRPAENVAVKVYKDPLLPCNACDFLSEERNLRKLCHPNIVKLHGMMLHRKSATAQAYPALVLELCDQTLSSLILRRPENVPATNVGTMGLVCNWAAQISDGLCYIHDEGLVHRDLKLENILVKERRIKIADVGLAKSVQRITGTMCGTALYMAPEVARGNMYGPEADVYSLALVLWEMWYGQRVFSELGSVRQEALFAKIGKGYRPRHLGGGASPPPPTWQNVLLKCWDDNPESRLTAGQCYRRFRSLLSATADHHR